MRDFAGHLESCSCLRFIVSPLASAWYLLVENVEGATLTDYSGHAEGVYCDCCWNGGYGEAHRFMFHLSKRIADVDLILLFSPFGRIAITKVDNVENRFLWTSESNSARALSLSAMTLLSSLRKLFTG